MKPLRASLPLVLGESPASYASRLAYFCGFECGASFCAAADLDLYAISAGEAAQMRGLAALSGSTIEAIARFAVVQDIHRRYRVAGQLVEGRWIVRSKLRLCPLCVAEELETTGQNGFTGQAGWQMAFLRECPTHGVALVALDPLGDGSFPHDFSRRVRTHRDEILQLADRAVVSSPSKATRYIAGRIMGEAKLGWLDAVELNPAISFVTLLGVLLVHGAATSPSELEQPALCDATDLGLTIALQGPSAILTALRDELPRPSFHEKAQGHLGPLYEWLSRGARQPYHAPLKALMRQYIIEAFPYGEGDLVLGERVTARRVHTLATFSRQCRVAGKRIRAALVAAGFLKLDPDTGAVLAPGTFDAESAETIRLRLNDGITRIQAMHLLDAPRAQFDALVADGLLTPQEGLGDITPHFSKQKVENLLDGLIKAATPVPVQEMPATACDLQIAARKLVCGAGELVRLILSGQLKAVHVDISRQGYAGLRVDVEEIWPHLEGVGVEGFTREALAKQLGLTYAAIQALLDRQDLVAVKSRSASSRKAALVITPGTLEEFLAVYMPMRELSDLFKVRANTTAAILKQVGLEPLDLGTEANGRLYARSEIRRRWAEILYEADFCLALRGKTLPEGLVEDLG
ncbi:TniQ family protein [Phaeobacter sp. HF9A]|uniref:TniQ family protein n=1 Tax=Phaeobacter sp. HF9A TaxID=2721561 RepID=UPI00142FF99C|nr:TniQ family protein [Phaeobacter sp. HF9A]NIZ11927.1 hypothetical protein [Phaeobacter sp. HF9A]